MNKQSLCWALVCATMAITPAFAADIQKGDQLQTLSNLHPDQVKRLLYTVNYQQPGLIPVCSSILVTAINGKKMEFEFQSMKYTVEYEKNTRSAGIEFQDALSNYFGKACDQAKLSKLSKIDKEGVTAGQPRVGMSKEGILFAMGRPPQHANPALDSNSWLYWQNRFGKTAIEFDAKGKVSSIR